MKIFDSLYEQQEAEQRLQNEHRQIKKPAYVTALEQRIEADTIDYVAITASILG